ncbi:MAG: hypothetical protein ABI763_16305 [Bacteroidota bacterium]
MKKTKNDQSSKKSRTMLGQEIGSMEDIQTNQDFNNEHPKHTDSGFSDKNLDAGHKKVKNNIKPTVEKQIVEKKNKKGN